MYVGTFRSLYPRYTADAEKPTRDTPAGLLLLHTNQLTASCETCLKVRAFLGAKLVQLHSAPGQTMGRRDDDAIR